MLKEIAIPEHLIGKIKKRELTRNEFTEALKAMKVGNMIEVPDAQYKYNTVRGRVSEVNRWLRLTQSGKRLITTRQNGTPTTLVMCQAGVLAGDE